MNDNPRPNHKDIAESYRLLLDLGLSEVADVVAWVDSVIVSAFEAPAWAMDLSLCGKASPWEAAMLLRRVPGEPTNDLPRKMVCSVLRERRLRGALSDDAFATAWFCLFPDFPEEGDVSRHAADVWQWLDEVLLSVQAGDPGTATLELARAGLASALEPYACYRELLPYRG